MAFDMSYGSGSSPRRNIFEVEADNSQDASEMEPLLGSKKKKGWIIIPPRQIIQATLSVPRIKERGLVAALCFVGFLMALLIYRLREYAMAPRAPRNESPRYPHVLFFVADDQGWNDIGYQSTDLMGLTPTIDALAADGIKLTAYYTLPVCTPARAALLTGLYPIHTGMQHYVITSNYPYGLPLDLAIMPQYFQVRPKLVYDCSIMYQFRFCDNLLPNLAPSSARPRDIKQRCWESGIWATSVMHIYLGQEDLMISLASTPDTSSLTPMFV